jgi:hypothetical protein
MIALMSSNNELSLNNGKYDNSHHAETSTNYRWLVSLTKLCCRTFDEPTRNQTKALASRVSRKMTSAKSGGRLYSEFDLKIVAAQEVLLVPMRRLSSFSREISCPNQAIDPSALPVEFHHIAPNNTQTKTGITSCAFSSLKHCSPNMHSTTTFLQVLLILESNERFETILPVNWPRLRSRSKQKFSL